MILVDSSVWIAYFKGDPQALPLDKLIDFNNICINDLILAELIPSINLKNEDKLKKLLFAITKVPLTINWNSIISLQTQNLKKGINKVGIPDLIILQNVIDNDLELYTFDRHFELMSEIHSCRLFKSED